MHLARNKNQERNERLKHGISLLMAIGYAVQMINDSSASNETANLFLKATRELPLVGFLKMATDFSKINDRMVSSR